MYVNYKVIMVLSNVITIKKLVATNVYTTKDHTSLVISQYVSVLNVRKIHPTKLIL